MVSPKVLLSTIESALLGPSPPTPSQRIELMHAIRQSNSSLKSLLSYPPPKASDRSQVESKKVRLPDSSPISLDDQDVQIALKLSDDLHLNEIDCVQLLVSANQEWGLLGREPLEILRLAAGLWYTARRDLITALYTLLRAVVLDQGFEADIVADIQKYLEDLINAGLRQRLISLIKELNREESAGLGGPHAERYILDSRGALVERRAVVYRERVILGHCLVLSVLVVRTSKLQINIFIELKFFWLFLCFWRSILVTPSVACPKDVKDVFSALKDSAAEVNGSSATLKLQTAFSLLFSVVIAFISDALSTVPDKASVLSRDASFRHEFQELVMAHGNDPNVEGFVDGIRLAWTVHLILTQDGTTARETIPGASSSDLGNMYSCLEVVFSNNVFQFLLDKILRTAAYQNDDEDMIYMYNAYLHKLMTCFLSHPLARDKVREMKEKAMSALSPYLMAGSHDFIHDIDMNSQQATETSPQPFVSLLELVSEIYQHSYIHGPGTYAGLLDKEPELLSGNEVLWTFVNFAGEDHTNFQTLVAFLKMLSTLASSQEGASKVFELLQGKTFRSIGWSTLFDCLSIYEQKFKQSLQSTGAVLPEFQEGDAKALVAYLNVLQKVVENGNPIERRNWFPDIEPLFKLLGYENVPPYLKGALRNAIATFIQVSPVLKDTIWSYLEQYDLPVVVGPPGGNNAQQMVTQVYDMLFELNEVEARREKYPSTISFLNLLNALIAEERDVSDRGHRFVGIFRFVYDHVFGPFPQRAYADPSEKWQLVVACLQHFRMILRMYDIKDEDIDSVDRSQSLTVTQSAPLEMQLPVVELLKDFMSGKTTLRNIMSILLPGVNAIISDRTNQVYGQLLEKAVHLSLDIIILVLEKDLFLADYWRPLYQIGIPRFGFGENFDPGSYVVGVLESLSSKEKRTDRIITQNVKVHDLSVICAASLAVLEYYFLQAQGSLGLSIMGGPNSNLGELLEFEEENKLLFKEIEEKRKIIGASPVDDSLLELFVDSSRMVGLVQLLLKSNSANCLIEDYAACLELRSEECQVIENSRDDAGVLIMQLLIDNINRPAPNITHLLLKFDLDIPVEQTILQPKFHYSCLKVILDILEKLSKPDVNALLHEFGFQLLYELCLDPLTCGPTMDLLSNKKYQFFIKHLDTVGVAPLPKRNNNQAIRISSLHQRAWLLKLLALELHAADMTASTHREACQSILAQIFGQDIREFSTDPNIPLPFTLHASADHAGIRNINKSKVLELLEVVQFKSPDTTMKYSQFVSKMKYDLRVEDILGKPATSEKGGVYYYSERGDRLIDLASFRDKLWQKCNFVNPQLSSFGNEVELNDVRETIHHLLRWGWKYNKNLEEQAAQLHMLTGWSQIVEISASRRMSCLENRSEILFEVLDASLSASASPDCSLKMAIILSQVALTCMAKLRDERFLSPGGVNSDNVTCLDIILVKQLSNGACHSILFKLIMAILRDESSEALRRRQYALLLSYLQYCQHMLDPDIPASVLQFLLHEEQDGEDMDLQKIDKEQAELARANFSILRKEAQAILDLVASTILRTYLQNGFNYLYILMCLIPKEVTAYDVPDLLSLKLLAHSTVISLN
ncbi:hypothetical protein HHK36_021467 [Tetracentron sinense]|uniref:Nuclear pore complex protein NUP205 n=1 Tax=Tetracentron sinense TaxID=13715 RepID=A0A835D7V4_TETSI|nr:hypothetical protein HHK36_021467 [Tetracentron sinense]